MRNYLIYQTKLICVKFFNFRNFWPLAVKSAHNAKQKGVIQSSESAINSLLFHPLNPNPLVVAVVLLIYVQGVLLRDVYMFLGILWCGAYKNKTILN